MLAHVLFAAMDHIPQRGARLDDAFLFHQRDGVHQGAHGLGRRDGLLAQDDDLGLVPLMQRLEKLRLAQFFRVVILE